MRIWIEYLLNYPTATDDFHAWLENVKQTLTQSIITEAQEGNTKKVELLAIELGVYEQIGRKFKAEQRERAAQLK